MTAVDEARQALVDKLVSQGGKTREEAEIIANKVAKVALVAPGWVEDLAKRSEDGADV